MTRDIQVNSTFLTYFMSPTYAHFYSLNTDKHGQPGCIHANMDIFRYAYELYPLIPAELLVSSTELALSARRVDMRASPYDVSMFEGCEDAIEIERTEGRRQYVMEQEGLASRAVPIRRQLFDIYDQVLCGSDGEARSNVCSGEV
jgi:hypothetical protein